jgi:hypothetical protein
MPRLWQSVLNGRDIKPDALCYRVVLEGEGVMRRIILLVFSLLPSLVVADQCAYISKAEAVKAATYVSVGQTIAHFCEPCGDKKFSNVQPSEVRSTELVRIDPASSHLDQTYWELRLNGKGVDLAYIYVKRSNARYMNLAKLAGCAATDVSSSFMLPNLQLK